ncbi:MAG: AI-2E family transporter [Chloroflexota bacterium]
MKKYGQWSQPVRFVVLAMVFLIFFVVLWYIRSILEPLVIAAFVAYLINPAVNFLSERTRLQRKSSVNLVYFITLAIAVGTPATLAPLFFDELTRVAKDVIDLFNQLIAWLETPKMLPGIPVDFGQFATPLIQFRSTFLSSLPDQALQLLGKTSMGALWAAVILVAVYYFLAEWPRLRDGFIDSFPEKYKPELTELYQRVRRIWMGFLRGQLLLMAIVTVAFTIAWTLVGLPGAIVLGVIAGFLTLIPDIGPFLAVMLAIGVALLEGSNWWTTLPNWVVAGIVMAVYLVLISLKNFWVRPLVMGRSVHMNEAIVLISILLATVLWGILGALLVVPVLASLAVIMDYLRRRILGMEPFPEGRLFILEEPPVSGSEKMAALKSRISRKGKG